MTPSVGRIVHVIRVEGDGVCNAAIVTAVGQFEPGAINVHVFPDSGAEYNMLGVKESFHKGPGWHWPERVE